MRHTGRAVPVGPNDPLSTPYVFVLKVNRHTFIGSSTVIFMFASQHNEAQIKKEIICSLSKNTAQYGRSLSSGEANRVSQKLLPFAE